MPAAGSEGTQQHGIPVVAPAGARSSLFVNRQAFREPTRNPVVGHLQSDHVRVFMPKRTAPVEFAGGPRRWRICGNDLAKANSESAETW